MRRLRIVHVISKFSPAQWGGAEEVVLNLGRRQAAAHNVEVFSTNAFVGPGRQPRLLLGVLGGRGALRIRRFRYLAPTLDAAKANEWSSRGIHLLSPSMALATLLRRSRKTIFHLHLHNSITAVASLCCLLRGIPYVMHLHSRYESQSSRDGPALLGFARRLFSHHDAIGRAGAIICPSEAHASAVRAMLPAARVVMIPNGVDPTRFARGNGRSFREKFGLGDRKVLLNVGKIYPVKNQGFLVRTWKRVQQLLPEAALVLIGHIEDQAYYSELEREIRASSKPGDVVVIPGLAAYSKELADAYAACDCFLLPSLEETFGMAVLEAWASGRPVIASYTDGTGAIIRNGIDGFLMQSWDENAWVSTMAQVLCDDGLRSSLTANAKASLQKYCWEGIANAVMALYDQVLTGAGK